MINIFFHIAFITTLSFCSFSYGDNTVFTSENLEYSPYIKGAIIDHGTPISNQKIILGIGVNGSLTEHSTQTDSKGIFEFLPVTEKRIFPRNPLIEHYVAVYIITILDNGDRITLWDGVFHGYIIHDYARENMKHLLCDIASPLKYYAFSIDDKKNDDYYINSQCRLSGFIDSGLYEDQ